MTARKHDQAHHDLVRQYLPSLILNTILGTIHELGDPYAAKPGLGGMAAYPLGAMRSQTVTRRTAVPVRRIAVCGPGGGKIDGWAWAHVGVEDAFEETYHRNSIMEPVFSSLKCRFTAVVRVQRHTAGPKAAAAVSGAPDTACCHDVNNAKNACHVSSVCHAPSAYSLGTEMHHVMLRFHGKIPSYRTESEPIKCT